jgi:hypothetical protein
MDAIFAHVTPTARAIAIRSPSKTCSRNGRLCGVGRVPRESGKMVAKISRLNRPLTS